MEQNVMSSEMELAELQETLYNSRNPTRRWLHCSRRDWIVDALRHEAAVGVATECAIEVGPGSGIYLPILAELYKHVIGTDIEQQYLQASHRLLYRYPNVELLIDDITSSRLPSASADLLLCTEVIEHISDSATALKEMRRILRPGGVLVLSTPQRYSPLELAAKVAFL